MFCYFEKGKKVSCEESSIIMIKLTEKKEGIFISSFQGRLEDRFGTSKSFVLNSENFVHQSSALFARETRNPAANRNYACFVRGDHALPTSILITKLADRAIDGKTR